MAQEHCQPKKQGRKPLEQNRAASVARMSKRQKKAKRKRQGACGAEQATPLFLLPQCLKRLIVISKPCNHADVESGIREKRHEGQRRTVTYIYLYVPPDRIRISGSGEKVSTCKKDSDKDARSVGRMGKSVRSNPAREAECKDAEIDNCDRSSSVSFSEPRNRPHDPGDK